MVQDFTTDSEVPLTEDVLKEKPREFIKSFLEWIPDGNVEQIIKSANRSTIGSSTIYAVPKNFTLFITSIWQIITCTGVGAATTRRSNILITGDIALQTLEIIAIGAQESMTQSFSMPLKISEKNIIIVNQQHANMRSQAGFIGFLLPKKISFR